MIKNYYLAMKNCYLVMKTNLNENLLPQIFD